MRQSKTRNGIQCTLAGVALTEAVTVTVTGDFEDESRGGGSLKVPAP